ncbi:hypothetical protein U9M48_041242 [Paspalum notatum var. saurae]|uniref:Uncharacterized protein n=1 Tax=Paspalum notatum var. saurae TaxID=547442 RepID=A0AAQ3US90_PASNO
MWNAAAALKLFDGMPLSRDPSLGLRRWLLKCSRQAEEGRAASAHCDRPGFSRRFKHLLVPWIGYCGTFRRPQRRIMVHTLASNFKHLQHLLALDAHCRRHIACVAGLRPAAVAGPVWLASTAVVPSRPGPRSPHAHPWALAAGLAPARSGSQPPRAVTLTPALPVQTLTGPDPGNRAPPASHRSVEENNLWYENTEIEHEQKYRP